MYAHTCTHTHTILPYLSTKVDLEMTHGTPPLKIALTTMASSLFSVCTFQNSYILSKYRQTTAICYTFLKFARLVT